MLELPELDYYLGQVVSLLTDGDSCTNVDLETVEHYLQLRIKTSEKKIAKCKPVSKDFSTVTAELYFFNIGIALKNIFDFTYTCKNGVRPNKLYLKRALNYIRKEKERLNHD